MLVFPTTYFKKCLFNFLFDLDVFKPGRLNFLADLRLLLLFRNLCLLLQPWNLLYQI